MSAEEDIGALRPARIACCVNKHGVGMEGTHQKAGGNAGGLEAAGGRLKMSTHACSFGSSFRFSTTLGFLLGHPSVPGFSEGGVFSGKEKRNDVIIGDFPKFGPLPGKELDRGTRPSLVAVIQIPLDGCA